MNHRNSRSTLALGVLSLCALSLGAAPQGTQEITKDNAVKGEMTIVFMSRKEASETNVDNYTFKLNVADFVTFDGSCARTPETSIEYNVKILAHKKDDAAQVKQVGQWKGVMGIDSEGRYQLRGTKKLKIEDAHRLMIAMLQTPPGMAKDNLFDGVIQGKKPKTTGWWAKAQEAAKTVKEYTRNIGGKTVKISVQNPDPLGFQELKLAAGPHPVLTEVVVNGNLDYDYSSGNWLTERISMKYMADGKQVEDVVTGSIRWVEETGKFKNDTGQEKEFSGYYDFNLRFNEARFADASGGDAFFGGSDEDIFFAEDNKIPSLLGRVYYYDSDYVGEGEEEAPTKSVITYALKSNKLTQVQLVNFMKLWLLSIGPTNDE